MVYFRMQGNLGHLMFQRAAALSLNRGKTVAVGPASAASQLRGFGDLFKGVTVVPASPMNVMVVRQKPGKPVQIPADDGRDVYLDGGFQSENYFDADIVYEWAKPSDGRIAILKQQYGGWLSRPDVTSLAVRRGDFLKNGAQRPFVGAKYFQDALAAIPEAKDFVVCSDDIFWCRNFFATSFPGRRFLFVESESVLDMLAVQALCANNVITNSSFAWWGAWLAKERRRREGRAPGRVLAPSMWYGYAAQKAGVTWDDIYFEGMEIVPNAYTFRTWLAAHVPLLSAIA